MSPENMNIGLAGLRVLSLESRRADQMARLIENYGGAPQAIFNAEADAGRRRQ